MKKLFLLATLMLLTICAKAQQMPEHIIKLMYAGNIIENFYVDDADSDKITEEGIKAMLKALDPHSTYTDPKETKSLLEQMEGSFGGIGIQFNIVSDTLYVIQTTTNGPSERAGILPGDKIVAVNDTTIAGVKMERADIMTRLRGEKGTAVKVDVVRRGIDRVLTFNLVRDDISTQTVDAAYMIDKNCGYIRITSFGAKTHGEFVAKLDSLKKHGMKNLVLDLSGNGGGYLTAAVGIAGEFIDEAKLVVYTEGKKNPRYDYLSRGEGKFRKGNLVVIVDETSASASEILAGAIQDWDRGIIVGRRTFGKGLVQRPFQLPDGSMIRLTVAHYYTPTGRCIQKPYVKGQKEEYDRDVLNRLNHGELMHVDSIKLDSTKVYKTLNKGRTVYGGGGIMPDVFVPLDTTRYADCFTKINRNNIIIPAVLKYVDQHRKALLKKYKKFDTYLNGFVAPDELIQNILAEAEEKKIKPKDEADRIKTIANLQETLKCQIANNLWDLNELYRVYSETDPIVQRALQELQKTEK